MASFFISHSGENRAWAERVRDRLQAEGYASMFIFWDEAHGIRGGRDWEREIYRGLRANDAVLFLISAESVASHWCFAEIAMARSIGRTVYPLKIAEAETPDILLATQLSDFTGDEDSAWRKLLATLREDGLGPEDAFAWDPTREPYPGLSAFDANDAAVFFGRDRESRELLDRLETRVRIAARSVALIGASGSGKSSLLAAGLLPRIAKRPDRWLVLPTVKPGARPLRALAGALARARDAIGAPAEWQQLELQLAAGGEALAKQAFDIRVRSGCDHELLLPIDQLEELFTRAGERERATMADLLANATTDPDGPLWIVAVLRSDFLARALEEPQLVALLRDPILLAPLDRGRLADVIARPAARAGLMVEPALVTRMVEETQGGDALALLAYTLQRLYRESRDSGRLTIEMYDAIDGVTGALRTHADRLAESLERDHGREAVLATLTRLVSVDWGQPPTRRRVPLASLRDDERAIIDPFVAARLLNTDEEAGQPVVQVAHEALLRNWPPLTESIRAAERELAVRTEAERAASDWERSGRRTSYLLRGDRLADVTSWLDGARGGDASPLLREFVAASTSLDESTLAREADQLAARVLQDIGHDPEAAILLCLAAIDEYTFTPRLFFALHTAVHASRVRACFRHDGPVNAVSFSPDGSLVLTCSVDGTARIWSATTGEQHRALVAGTGAVYGAAFSPDGTRIVTSSQQGAAHLWDVATGREIRRLIGHESTTNTALFSPDGRRVVTASEDGTARIWMLDADAEPLVLRGHQGKVIRAAVSPDGRAVVTVSVDATARVWSAQTGEEIECLRPPQHPDRTPGPIWTAAIDDSGAYLVTSADDWSVHVWDLRMIIEPRYRAAAREQQGRGTPLWHEFREADGQVWATAFRPGTTQLAAATDAGPVHLYDVKLRKRVRTLIGHDDTVNDVAFSADGSQLITASDDGTARIWDSDTGREVATLRGHAGAVFTSSFSADGAFAVTASDQDATARVWALRDRGERVRFTGHSDEVTHAVSASNGTWLATGSASGVVRIWNRVSGRCRRRLLAVADPAAAADNSGVLITALDIDRAERRILGSTHGGDVVAWNVDGWDEVRRWRLDGFVVTAALSPDGESVIAAQIDGTIVLLDVASGKEMHRSRGDADAPTHAAFGLDGARAVAVSLDGVAVIWDAATWAEIVRIDAAAEERAKGMEWRARPLATAISADESCLALPTGSGKIAIVDMNDGRTLHELNAVEGVGSLSFAPDGRRLAEVSYSGAIRLHPLDGGREIAWEAGALPGHLGFSPDGTRLVTGSGEGAAHVWDTATGQEIMRLRGHAGPVFVARFTDDGREILTAGADATAALWPNFRADELIELAKQRVYRELAGHERTAYFFRAR